MAEHQIPVVGQQEQQDFRAPLPKGYSSYLPVPPGKKTWEEGINSPIGTGHYQSEWLQSDGRVRMVRSIVDLFDPNQR